jgi:phage major head subunit gpT-like protein
MPTGAYINLADPAIIGSFYESMEAEWSKSWASTLGWLNPSSVKDQETYAWLGAVPKFREWIGGRVATKPQAESYSIRNKLWEQTLEFGLDDLRRDKTGQVQARIGELAAAGAGYWEDLVTTLINAGGSGTCYDGEYFWDTDHPVSEMTSSSTTAKNSVSASDYSVLNIGTSTAPTPDEAAKIVQAIVGHFMTLKNDQGHLLNSRARQFTLMVSTVDLWAPIQSALALTNLTSGASNPVMGLKSMGYQIDAILNPNLTSATSLVYAIRTDAKLKPFILQEEYGTQVKVVGAGSELEFNTRRHQFGTERMGNAGYGLWQYAVKATLS